MCDEFSQESMDQVCATLTKMSQQRELMSSKLAVETQKAADLKIRAQNGEQVATADAARQVHIANIEELSSRIAKTEKMIDELESLKFKIEQVVGASRREDVLDKVDTVMNVVHDDEGETVDKE